MLGSPKVVSFVSLNDAFIDLLKISIFEIKFYTYLILKESRILKIFITEKDSVLY